VFSVISEINEDFDSTKILSLFPMVAWTDKQLEPWARAQRFGDDSRNALEFEGGIPYEYDRMTRGKFVGDSTGRKSGLPME